MEDLKQQMQSNFLKYASYVILDRAIPNVIDGLKPVQRRILHTLYQIDDGKLHKVANVCGQTMAYHPHGDAPIQEALVNLANKNFLLDRQGNFGNLFTGDPAAAARYIETRLSRLAKETMFNPDLTPTLPSYDGRNQEPVVLPAKIPLLLMQGAEGIAVGMATKILPHNFCELIQSSIALLEGKPFEIFPDFISGGIMDASGYDKGRGKVKLRARIEVLDDKTLVINEICYGTTTESVISSIDEAAKKGKIKIDSIHDFTAEKVEIQIKLPRGQHASQVIDALYGFTECEISLNSSILVIKDNAPWETDVEEILSLYVEKLQYYLKTELEIERDRLLEKIFTRTLERIFIENRLYKKIEEVEELALIHEVMAASFQPFNKEMQRSPTLPDFERLLAIPIRRISRFDINRHKQEMQEIQKMLLSAESHLKQIKKFTIQYLKKLLQDHGKGFARRTEISKIAEVDRRAIALRKVRIGIDSEKGFFGLKVSGDRSFECTNFDKLLLLFHTGEFKVVNIPEKEFFTPESLCWMGVADKTTPLTAVWSDEKKHLFARRFVVDKFILEKIYRYFEQGCVLQHITSEDPPGRLLVEYKTGAKEGKKNRTETIDLSKVPFKRIGTKGLKIASKAFKKVAPQ